MRKLAVAGFVRIVNLIGLEIETISQGFVLDCQRRCVKKMYLPNALLNLNLYRNCFSHQSTRWVITSRFSMHLLQFHRMLNVGLNVGGTCYFFLLIRRSSNGDATYTI